jgi:YHYH protein
MYKKIALFAMLLLAASCGNTSDTTSTTTSSSTTNSCTGSTSNTTASGCATTTATIAVSSATLSSSTGCITNVNTAISTDLPSWATGNFTCQIGYTSGTNYVFKSANLPNHTSYYWCSAHPAGGTTCTSGQNATLWAALPGANFAAGTNVISSQSLVYTIPATPSLKTGTLTSSQGGLASIGITTNGLAIFNNAAAPPDNLSTEAQTFDSYGGHPQNSGVYHHHAAVNKLSSTMADSALIGVALDGYLIYAEYCDNGTVASGDDYIPTANTNAATGTATTDSVTQGGTQASLDRLHGHTTTTRHLSTATYHYHYMQDPTATIKTLMGSYFRGNIGSVSN